MMNPKPTNNPDFTKFRANVCAVICDDTEENVLMFHRAGIKVVGWQFPQGGVDPNEIPRESLFRELEEEIGVNDVTILDELEEWVPYFFPENVESEFVGQMQKWFKVQLNVSVDHIHFDNEPPEFDGFRWVKCEDAPNEIIEFKQTATRYALKQFGLVK